MSNDVLFQPLELPCGVTLKNRVIKAAMSDALGDGRGQPTEEQHRLYATWAEGGLAAAVVGEVQGTPHFAENPGNLVLRAESVQAFRPLAIAGTAHGAQLWVQLGHAGALAHGAISRPAGPSAIDVPGLRCDALSLQDVRALPDGFAQTAAFAQRAGFGGVEIHAAHGFLLSQFLSPLFNQRQDSYGGTAAARRRIVLDVVAAVRDAVGPGFPVAIKINASDMLQGGLTETDALELVAALEATSVDLIDISGGTYFPGAASSLDSGGAGPYFAAFAKEARRRTSRPLMLTGGIKSKAQAVDLLQTGDVDVVGLARALVLQPDLPKLWQRDEMLCPHFPKLAPGGEGAVTAWYTMRIAAIAASTEAAYDLETADALAAVKRTEAENAIRWKDAFRI
ncbi:oxidoreductase [Roseobacter sinensis]|uniref:Oxidoreductase n=1 Tax=Roseobacter sinensis TaxID=2931391 RepID=A0ABT3BKM7_9RHOB|nr:oxidoreductase [Roseobacter sp. WL0113]MCV3274123.1 oxidoreductase [Roseobacter sp. WL0113]